MKLRNVTNRVVSLRTKTHGVVMLKPNDCIDASLQFRREVESFVKQFGLRWELEDADLPPGTDASRYAGTYAFSEQQKKSDESFDARAANNQIDAKEIADVWNDVAVDRFVELDESESEEDEELIFIKETVENEAAIEGSEGREAAITEGAPTAEREDLSARAAWFQKRETESYEEVSDEGPDYLREEPPDGVEGYGERQTEYQKIQYEVAPANSPYTKSELMLGVKARLFEICDDLGLNSEGTKSDLINRIFYYYDHQK